jgi:hypothetical protein
MLTSFLVFLALKFQFRCSLVYIRGTAAQTQVAIRYISEYFGGRPALSTDEMVISTPEYTAVTVPNASLSFVFNNEPSGDWFPVDNATKIAGGMYITLAVRNINDVRDRRTCFS